MSELVSSYKPTGNQGRAIELLGQGIQPVVVAATLGVSESQVSQWISDENFLHSVVELRYKNLSRHNQRDAAYDNLEDEVLAKLQKTMAYIMDPMKLAKILQVVNAAKRRGQSTPDSIIQQSVVVNLTLPTAVINQFQVTKDVNNQILEAGDQKLLTMQSGTLLEKLQKAQKIKQAEHQQVVQDRVKNLLDEKTANSIKPGKETNDATSRQIGAITP